MTTSTIYRIHHKGQPLTGPDLRALSAEEPGDAFAVVRADGGLLGWATDGGA